MADTPDLGSGPARGGGSSPLARTNAGKKLGDFLSPGEDAPMRKAPGKPAPSPKTTSAGSTRAARVRTHPVIIYPFRQPHDFADLTELYGLVRELAGQPDIYTRPITVMDRKTHYAGEQNQAFVNF